MAGIKIRSISSIAAAMSRQQSTATIPGVAPIAWPDPLQPVRPMMPPGTPTLAWPIGSGQNLEYTARFDAKYNAEYLQTISRYPLARLCIRNVKDSVGMLPWRIQLRPQPGEKNEDRQKREQGDTVLQALNRIFEYPDGEKCWADWVRPLIEDMLVVDAASILIRRRNDKTIAELRVIPGKDIACYVDENGFTPKPPNPAYAQLYDGMPRTNLTTDELVYCPRNIVWHGDVRASYLYGTSPTEEMAPEIEVGISRLAYTLGFYKDGSIPNFLHVVPANVPVEKVKEQIQFINAQLAGNLQKRREYMAIQGFRDGEKDDQIIFPKEPDLSNSYDDLHIHKLCFGYGVSPQRLMRMMNRATAEQSQDAAEEEGIAPYVKWLFNRMNFIIQMLMGLPQYEMAVQPKSERDPLKQAQADQIDVNAGVRTRNEVRVSRDLDPRTEPDADKLCVTTATGAMPLGDLPAPTKDNPTPVQPKPEPGAGSKPKQITSGEPGKKKVAAYLVPRR